MSEEKDVLENFDDLQETDNEPTEIPKEVRKIKTQAYDKSVSDIVRMINDGDINLNPEYQRNYIWNNNKASLLIESIILNVPIPVIYVSQEDDDSWTVIDGLQRLNSLKRFFDRDFKLSGLEIMTELSKSDVKTLNPKALRVLKNGLLRVIVISNDSHPEIKYDVFMRLNNGAVKLNAQELRNCLYRGEFNRLLKECSENPKFLEMMKLKEPHNRMSDCELILRFFALQRGYDPDEGFVTDYKGRMKNYLNDFMRAHQSISSENVNNLQTLFNDTVDKVYDIFGGTAFRRINEDGEQESALNRSLIDVLMISFSFHSYDDLLTNKTLVKECLYNLMQYDKDFTASIRIGTSDKSVLNYRIARWMDELTDLL